MKKVDIQDGTTLIEKLMAHFGWYKVQMTEMKCDNLEVTYSFGVNIPENPLWPEDKIENKAKPTVKRPAAKKVNTRKQKNGN